MLRTDSRWDRFARTVRCLSGAFTLLELLVVIGVIGLIAGLLLPAVQSAREASRRAQCVSNLKQIGVAIASYQSVHGVFPTSQLLNRFGVLSNSLAEQVFILPYVEQSALYDSINIPLQGSTDAPSLENHTARHTRLGLYLCPSDGEPVHLNTYRFNSGRLCRTQGNGHLWDGPFSIGVLPTPAKITDGLSQTAFVSERIAGSFLYPGGYPRDIKVWFEGGPGPLSDAEFDPLCIAAPVPIAWKVVSGRFWMYEGLLSTHYNHNGLPNDPRPSCTGELPVINYVYMGFHPPRSYHPGVVNVLLGDGHVRAVANSINFGVWTALGTYNAGDVVGDY